MTNSPYVGRFAPSPTGPLHLGSLLAAVASYLDARAQQGRWLLRIEDLDPPREPPGTATIILSQLEHYGFEWDGEVLYQSKRLDAYAEALVALANEGLCFRCTCTRADLRTDAHGEMGAYSGRCRAQGITSRDLQYGDETRSIDYAIRCRVETPAITLVDRIQGEYTQNLAEEVGDFVIRRKDGLFAYQLAVVVDDAFQGVNNIIRGIDLLDSTPRQIYLQRKLGYATPDYGHIPVIVDKAGDKLSKQSFAPALNSHEASQTLHLCLALLGLSPPRELRGDTPAKILDWGISRWDIQAVPKLATLENTNNA